jgi:D-alanyl-D-alanine carboxypeptidase/D-alanyl-D-alanine-endopeptidase (penicillin-binding protein 4)
MWLSLVFLAGCFVLPREATAQPRLSPQIEQIITQNRANHAFWSLTVRDTTGKVLEAYNSKKLMRPASNMKLLTSAMVLHELGPYFTYKTRIYGVGRQKGKVWNGDIIIRGAGDPSINGSFYNDDPLHVMHEIAAILASKGIHKIKGNLVGNDSFFDEKPYPDGWCLDDLTYYYAVPTNALSFNNNTVDLTVYAKGAIGAKPTIEWFPFNTNFVHFINEQVITPPNAYYQEHYHRIMGTNTIILRNSLPQGYVERESLSVSKPALYFLNTLKKYLQQGGIHVTGHLIVNNNRHEWNPSTYKLLGVHYSPPLRKLIRHLNKESDNFYAEMLLKTAAAEHFNTQGTTDLGVSLSKKFAWSVGINTSNMLIKDGSGMSTYDLISTSALSQLLTAMRKEPHFKIYKNSLPIAAIDGTLEYRFNHTPLAGRIIAKTGSVSGVRVLSGYLKTRSNKTLIFSINTNDYITDTSYIDSVDKSILMFLYNHY